MLRAYREAGLDEIVVYCMHERQQLQDVLAVMSLQPAFAGR